MPKLDLLNRPGLSLSGKLQIELTAPSERVGNLLNERATPDATIVGVKLKVEVFDGKTFRPPTPEELDGVAFNEASIRLRSDSFSGDPVAHAAPNGAFFTLRQLLEAVEETERQTRGQSQWLGGVDVHHVYFEGIFRTAGHDECLIIWGS